MYSELFKLCLEGLSSCEPPLSSPSCCTFYLVCFGQAQRSHWLEQVPIKQINSSGRRWARLSLLSRPAACFGTSCIRGALEQRNRFLPWACSAHSLPPASRACRADRPSERSPSRTNSKRRDCAIAWQQASASPQLF